MVSTVISSHGHIDHAGGLLNIRKKMNAKQNIPLLLHEHAFRKRLVKFQDGRNISLPAPIRPILIKAGYNIIEKKYLSCGSKTDWFCWYMVPVHIESFSVFIVAVELAVAFCCCCPFLFGYVLLKIQGLVILLCTEYNAHKSIAIDMILNGV